jgi:myo-inositol-1(or 4)-monophosphatase
VLRRSKSPHELPQAAVEAVINIVLDVIATYRPRLLDMAVHHDSGERANPRHADNFLSVIDVELHDVYRRHLHRLLGPIVYASEEGDPEVLSDGAAAPRYLVIVDPLDTSELAVRGLLGYTHVVVYSLLHRHPLLAVVGDFFHEVHLFGAQRVDGADAAWLRTRGGGERPLVTSRVEDVSHALVTSYSMRPTSRFLDLARSTRLLNALAQDDEGGRIGVDFGSVGLCHVAAGFSDAMIETAKGFALWDVYPGQYVLHSAGGIVCDLDGEGLPLTLDVNDLDDVSRLMRRKQKFVAAGTPKLAARLLGLVRDDESALSSDKARCRPRAE